MNQKKPIIYMLISALSFAIMGFLVKDLSAVSLPVKVLFRNGVVFLLILIIQVSSRRPLSELFGRIKYRKLLVLRGIAGTFGIFGYFFSLGHLTLGDASMLNRLSPFFVMLFAFLFLRVHPKRIQIAALIMAFTGALFILQPGGSDYSAIKFAAGISGFLGAAAAGLAYTIIGKIGADENPLAIMSYFAVFSFFATIPFLFFTNLPGSNELLRLLMLGFLAGVGQWFLTLAYQQGNPNRVSIFNYSNILFSIMIDVLIIGNLPEILSIIGAGFIFSAAFLSWKWG